MRAALGLAALLIPLLGSTAPPLDYQVVARYPHDPHAFTQGLVWSDGRLFESTGGYGHSSLREVELDSGRVLREHRLPRRFFGEGLTLWKDTLVQLTWREGLGLIYGREDFAPRATFALAGEGWGLAQNGRHWILSDGSAWLSILDPDTGATLRRLQVTDAGRPVERLNELEWIEGACWANVWLTERILRIDPESGAVSGELDLSRLWPKTQRPPDADVLNGIAWRADRRHLLVTGKRWPWLFELALE